MYKRQETIDRKTVREALEIELESVSMALPEPIVPDKSYLSDTKILLTLERNHGNRKKTAAELGISTTTLWRRLRAIDETE